MVDQNARVHTSLVASTASSVIIVGIVIISTNGSCSRSVGLRCVFVTNSRTSLDIIAGSKVSSNLFDRVRAIVAAADQVHLATRRTSGVSCLNYFFFVDGSS